MTVILSAMLDKCLEIESPPQMLVPASVLPL
jgi:hypothetical protein